MDETNSKKSNLKNIGEYSRREFSWQNHSELTEKRKTGDHTICPFQIHVVWSIFTFEWFEN